MLAGERQHHETSQQLDFDSAVYAQVNAAAKKAWYKLPFILGARLKIYQKLAGTG